MIRRVICRFPASDLFYLSVFLCSFAKKTTEMLAIIARFCIFALQFVWNYLFKSLNRFVDGKKSWEFNS